ERVVARGLATTDRKADRLATTEEVALGNGAFDNEAAARAATGRIATTDGQFTRRLLDHVDNQDHLIGLRTGRGRDVHSREEIELLEPALGAGDQNLIERIAFAEVELTTNDVVTCAGVAADFDTLEIGARPLVDRVGNRDGLVFEIAIATR